MKDFFWDMIATDIPDEVPKDTFSFVDVRDIAAVHVAAMRKEEVSGVLARIFYLARTPCVQIFTPCANEFSWLSLGNLIQRIRPGLYTSGILPRGNPDLDQTVTFKYNADKGTSEEKMVGDILTDFEARGRLEMRVDPRN
ncbi:hypothetical protein CPB84DRAFT_1797374 [Gymnopilus junonius]|uniref:Uncharacterized protein n=1 Tax=Gymnopilus junonius TaxID=109634 RepID=A0A9P5TGF5_GYMJU|nr:hypothetical protein CPB84DRAFT_1797374 [Gymnopilus junonius]